MKKIRTIIYLTLYITIIFSVDTDGDGYSDEIELEVGTNPNSKEDRYYYGSWPYNPNKDEINGARLPISCPNNISCECTEDSDCINSNCRKSIRAGSYCTPKPGDTFPNLIAVDQYGESVDIYDFANQGKIIAIEFGTAWCAPCQGLASWLSNGDKAIESSVWWKQEYQVIKEMVDKGEIIFITILFENALKDPINYEDIVSWHEKYPNDKIPVLADEYKDIHQWMKPTGYPCINLLDENMRFINFTGRGLSEAFDILSGRRPYPKQN